MGNALPERDTRRNDPTHKQMGPRIQTGFQITRGPGKQEINKVGAFRKSAISAILLIIYMGDRAQDYTTVCDRSQIYNE